MSYLETAHELYKEASQAVPENLCCVERPAQLLPGLTIPQEMSCMDYGCGTTVHLGELSSNETILYVGIGGGMEALQFAYFSRRPEAVIAVDRVPEMIERAKANFKIAEQVNPWFKSEFIKIVSGDALNLPLPSECVDVAAQNCLFNIFKEKDLLTALKEMYRVLKPGGRLYISDPITTQPIPDSLRNDERLRAMCLSGALSFEAYVQKVIEAGFGEMQIRARRPYRLLDKATYGVDDILLETIELVAVKVPDKEMAADVFIGETAIYNGKEVACIDNVGQVYKRGVPVSVSQRIAKRLRQREDFVVTPPTYHYIGHKSSPGSCCCCG
ncbi:arsenosugar biosynthesis arsenite methyltransferase ArsM [Sporomusa acidovorans]|uniref:2-methoxy-6-polyprenyl-1,4-benzoquinol methylase, mitochondrial n=1 Tax=Sporomusa acidovorans (strain ATCC 49682 / DSM 3132 / Mol) TaxID=1123286 RepID=A0ABZ3IXI0_SPOA4|nr:arsenosugar biosynthesis arsenite methyltransferase ArsM [Sporomusa acidovorans]OZC23382.1 putative methyltransferase YcgJ [Sporomusa acidovorans DSM 3132]SDE43671.1 Methyltransferase domain-containing protein [Sporomusa acidovorans]